MADNTTRRDADKTPTVRSTDDKDAEKFVPGEKDAKLEASDLTSATRPEWAQKRNAEQLKGVSANQKKLAGGDAGVRALQKDAEQVRNPHGIVPPGETEVGEKVQYEHGNRGAVVGKIHGPDGVVAPDDTVESKEPQFASNPEMG